MGNTHILTNYQQKIIDCFQQNDLNQLKNIIPHIPFIDEKWKGYTFLNHALNTNNISTKIIKYLLKNKADPNKTNQYGRTSLEHVLIDSPKIEIINLLFENKADPNISFDKGYTLLHLLCGNSKNKAEIIRLMIENKADVNIVDENKQNAFAKAIHLIPKFIEFKLDPNQSDSSKKTPLHHSTISSNLEEIEKLIEYKADVNLKDNKMNTPLLIEIQKRTSNLNILKILVESKSDLNVQDARKNTPLGIHLTKEHVSHEIFRFLIESKARTNMLNSKDDSLLHCLIYNNLPTSFFETAIYSGNIDPNLPNVSLNFPLHIAINSKIEDEKIKIILDFNANPNFADSNGDTPLHYLAKKKIMKEDLFKHFFNHRADPNIKNKESQETPLHIICNKPKIDKKILELFLDQNPDVNILNKEKETPFFLFCKCLCGQSSGQTCRFSSNDLLSQFFENKADPNICNSQEKTPFLQATECENIREDTLIIFLKYNSKQQFDKKANSPIFNFYNKKNLLSLLNLENSVNLKDPINQNTILQFAIEKNANSEIIRFLLSKKANPNLQNKSGKTALHCSLQHSVTYNYKIIEWLFDYKADPNISNKFGRNSFHIAMNNKNISENILRLFIENVIFYFILFYCFFIFLFFLFFILFLFSYFLFFNILLFYIR